MCRRRRTDRWTRRRPAFHTYTPESTTLCQRLPTSRPYRSLLFDGCVAARDGSKRGLRKVWHQRLTRRKRSHARNWRSSSAPFGNDARPQYVTDSRTPLAPLRASAWPRAKPGNRHPSGHRSRWLAAPAIGRPQTSTATSPGVLSGRRPSWTATRCSVDNDRMVSPPSRQRLAERKHRNPRRR